MLLGSRCRDHENTKSRRRTKNVFYSSSWIFVLSCFVVCAMDTTGYGRSFRPAAMNDPCNLAKDRQAPFVQAPCAPSYGHALTTIASDWNDIDAVVDYIRALRRVDRVSLLGWSLGGP